MAADVNSVELTGYEAKQIPHAWSQALREGIY